MTPPRERLLRALAAAHPRRLSAPDLVAAARLPWDTVAAELDALKTVGVVCAGIAAVTDAAVQRRVWWLAEGAFRLLAQLEAREAARATDNCKNCGDEFDFDDPQRRFHGDHRYCEPCDIAHKPDSPARELLAAINEELGK